MMRLMDIMLALPTLLLAIAVVAMLGPGLSNAMLAVVDRAIAGLRAADPCRGASGTQQGLRRGLAHGGRRAGAVDVHRPCCPTAWRR